MKFRRRRAPLLLFLIPVLSSVIAQELGAKPPAINARDVIGSNVADQAVGPSANANANTKANPVGTKDAPVDGKDGMPHVGPFVETSAERSRKKAKESGDEEQPLKPIKSSVKDAYSSDADLPQSNEGVMDDPHRVGPKEGSRGTEGGVSEKSRDSKIGQEKKPDRPKEQPPLPHGEEPHEKATEEKEASKQTEEEKKLLEVWNSSSIDQALLTRIETPGST